MSYLKKKLKTTKFLSSRFYFVRFLFIFLTHQTRDISQKYNGKPLSLLGFTGQNVWVDQFFSFLKEDRVLSWTKKEHIFFVK